jgi:MraZ protein
MFTGEHERLLDEKGRLVLPPMFRRHLVNAAFLTKSLEDPCLLVYSEEEIGKAAGRLIEQVQRKDVSAHAQRIWSASITEVRADTQGRIAIPPKLRNEIGLEREIIVIGVINRAEIWTPGDWRNVEESTEVNLNESQWL